MWLIVSVRFWNFKFGGQTLVYRQRLEIFNTLYMAHEEIRGKILGG